MSTTAEQLIDTYLLEADSHKMSVSAKDKDKAQKALKDAGIKAVFGGDAEKGYTVMIDKDDKKKASAAFAKANVNSME